MRYAYLRQSLDATGAGDAVSRQRDQIERTAPEIAEWFVDNDISASTGAPRPEFERLLQTLRPGDELWIVRLDRLARRTKDLDRLIDVAETTTIKALDGEVRLDTPGGRATARVLVSIGQMESEVKGERHRAANRQRAERGQAVFGQLRPFGFRAGQDGAVEIVPEEADALRWAVGQVTGGASISATARAMPLPTTTGGTWAPQVLRRALLNPRLHGEIVLYAESVRKGRKRVPVRMPDGPAILTPEEHARLAELLRAPGRRSSTSQAPRHMLSGVGRCGTCDAPVYSAGRHEAYICKRGHVYRKVALADAEVAKIVPGMLARRLDPLTALDPEGPARAAELKELRGRRDAIAGMVEDGLIGAVAARESAARLSARILEIEGARADTEAARANFGRVAVALRRWDGMSTLERRALIAEHARVTILPLGRGGRATEENPGVRVEPLT